MKDQPFIINLADHVEADVVLNHNETSKTIAMGTWKEETVDIREIIPMEYDLTDISITDTGKGTQEPKLTLTRDSSGKKITGGTLTMYPGNRILITVTNTFQHEGYFKGRTSVKNVFQGYTKGN